MRRATRRDRNHAQVAADLVARGYGVDDLSLAGGGIADLLVSRGGHMRAVEVKNPATRPTKPRGASNAAKLARQAAFASRHPGCVLTVTSADEVDAAFAVWQAGRAV